MAHIPTERTSTQALSPFGQAAIAYAERGWHVFPCQPRAKQPVTAHGCRDATSDPSQVRQWWQQMPHANVAIATGQASGIWVLDVDAPDGIAALRELEQHYGKLPATLTQRTGGGGQQMFWRWPAGYTVRNTVGKLGPGLDTRGEGGYSIVPPSTHPNGQRYAWLPGPTEPVEAPGWLVDLATAKPRLTSPEGITRATSKRIIGLLLWLARQQPGNRNASLYWASCRLRDAGLPFDIARELAVPVAMMIGLDEREAERTVISAFKGGQRCAR